MSIDMARALRKTLSLSGLRVVFGSNQAVFAGQHVRCLRVVRMHLAGLDQRLDTRQVVVVQVFDAERTAERAFVLLVLTRSITYSAAGRTRPWAAAHHWAFFTQTTLSSCRSPPDRAGRALCRSGWPDCRSSAWLRW